MAEVKPIINYSGTLEELRAGDTLPASGGLVYFAESESEASPNATVTVSQLTPVQAATNADIVIKAKGTGAILAQIPDGTTTGGNKRGSYAVDFQMQRTVNADRVASGANSGILCGTSNKASGSASVCLGGDNNQATAQYAHCIGSNNTNAGTAAVTIGSSNSITAGSYSIVAGDFNSVEASQCFIAGSSNTGYSNGLILGTSNASGNNSYIHQMGFFCSAIAAASGRYTQAFGLYAQNQIPYAQHFAGGRYSAGGDAQTILAHLLIITTDNTSKEMLCGGAGAQRLVLPNDTTWGFSATVVGRRSDADNISAVWRVTGSIDNNANTVALAGTPVITNIVDDSAGEYTIAISADNINKALIFTVNGAVSQTVKWVATVEITQVTG